MGFETWGDGSDEVFHGHVEDVGGCVDDADFGCRGRGGDVEVGWLGGGCHFRLYWHCQTNIDLYTGLML